MAQGVFYNFEIEHILERLQVWPHPGEQEWGISSGEEVPLSLCPTAFAFAPSYEGTGRSLSLKLIQQLRQQSAQSQVSTTAENKTTTTARLASGTLSSDPGLQCTAGLTLAGPFPS